MKLINFSKKYFYIILAAILFWPIKSFGAVGNISVQIDQSWNPIKANDIYALINAVLDFVVKIGAVVVVFFIIYAGFQFVTAQGNDEKITQAKKTLLWTVVGALVLLGALTLSQIVCNTAYNLGANVSCNNPPPPKIPK